MRRILLLLGIVAVLTLVGCPLDNGGGSVDVDPALVGRWGETEDLGGAWEDQGGGIFIGVRFFSSAHIYAIVSDDGGVTWDEGDTGVDLTLAEGGVWETDVGGFGTYTIVGDDMTWVNNATGITFYFTKL